MPLRRLLAGLLLVLPAAAAWAQPCRQAACAAYFPPDAGAVNVRDYGAKGDGRTDDTAALTAAIAASGPDTGQKMWHDRVVFLPAGTYFVSDTLVKRYATGGFASGMVLVGEGVDRTILRLADHAAGFADPRAPRGVVMTTSKRLDTAGNRDYVHLGEGNDAYENFVENLTIDVGHGNPGAVGIDYLASNIGAVRDVAIRAPAGSGAIGMAMLRKWPGPALVQRVSVEGFDIGIDVGHSEYGMTLSQVQLSGQHLTGLRNAGNMLSVEELGVAGAPTAIANSDPGGLIVLAGGSVTAGTLANAGTIVFRGVHLPPGAIPAAAAGAATSGWLTGAADWHADMPAWSVKLTQAPLIDPGPVARWVGVEGQGDEMPPADSTERLQSAMRSGATTVYLRHGTLWISAPIEIPPTVHRIIGMNATIQVLPNRQPTFARTLGMFRIIQPGGPLAIERLAMDNSDRGAQVGVENVSSRTLLLRDIVSAGVITLDRRPTGGPAFLEDTCCGPLRVAGPQPVIARQFNTEGGGVRVINDGTPLAIIGLKTEQYGTVVSSRGGARTEILGGLIYVVVTPPVDKDVPAFINDNAAFAASFVEESLRAGSHYQTYLADRQGERSLAVAASTMPARGFGRLVPMLTAGSVQDGH